MKRYNSFISWLLIFVVAFTCILPASIVSASSLTEQLASAITAKPASFKETTPGSNLVDMLLSIMGDFFGNLLALPQDITQKLNLPSGIKANSSKELIGFYAEWWATDTSSFNSLYTNADVLRTIAPFWATLEGDGTITDRGGNDHDSVVSFAHKNNVSVLLLVNNAKSQDNQSPVHNILATPALRAKAINNLEAYIKKYKLDGINIDFEMVDAQDRDNLSAFMQELSERLKPQGYIISIDVFPKQNESNDVSVAYDYAQLAKYADKIILMTYDNHGTWSGAGPIADIDWVEKNLKYALQFIPKNKLYIGLAAYGYDWSSKGVESLEHKAVMKLTQDFNSTIAWDNSSKSPHFDYTDSNGIKHQVWFENSESLKYKTDLVTKYDIAGAAIWKLGEEDPNSWKVFKNVFSKK